MIAIAEQEHLREASDEELALDARVEPAAFMPLYDRYAERIERYAVARVGNREDAEDVVSETFTRALAKIGTFDPRRGTFASWLFGIARNAVNMLYRRRPPVSVEAGVWEWPDDGALPEQDLIHREHANRVRAALAALTPEQRDAIALRYLGQLSFAEIAVQLGKREGATRMLVQRGLATLRRQMTQEEMD